LEKTRIISISGISNEFKDQFKDLVDSIYYKPINNMHKMKNYSKENKTIKVETDKRHKDIQQVFKGKNPKKTYSNEDAEADLNSKILKITLTINEQYPELSKYIEEMPVTIPNEENPDVTLDNLKTYYESLSLMLNKYKSEHPAIGN